MLLSYDAVWINPVGTLPSTADKIATSSQHDSAHILRINSDLTVFNKLYVVCRAFAVHTFA